MTPKKILGIACIIVGAIFLFFSRSIAEQVASGKQQIESGQQRVNSFNNYFSATPYSKEMGRQLTAPSQRRIDQGNVEVAYYESLSTKFKIFGVILIILGVLILVIKKKKSKG